MSKIVMREWNFNGSSYRWIRLWEAPKMFCPIHALSIGNSANIITKQNGVEYLEKKEFFLCFPRWKKVWKEEIEENLLLKKINTKKNHSKLEKLMIERYNMPSDDVIYT